MTPFFTSLHSTFHVGRLMFNVLLFLLVLTLTTQTTQAQPPAPGDNPTNLINLPAGKFLWWYGYTGRTYFIQVSDIDDPLAKWNWAPIIEAGNDTPISYEVDGTASRKFFRLKPTDLPIPFGKTIDTADFDQDGISNLNEINPASPLEAAGATDPLNADTDADGMNDGYERANGFDPNDDGTRDPDSGSGGDADGDGSANAEEMAAGTDPNNADSDGDGLADGVEQSSGSGTDPQNPDSDADGALDGKDADPQEVLVNWEKSAEFSYLMIEVQTPFETGLPDDLNDKGEVLIGGGIWAGGVWTPSTSPSITGVFPNSVSENFPDGIGYRINYLGWNFFNNDRKLLQVGEIEPTDGPGSGGGTVCPLFWTVGQSTPSLIYETADLWENLYSSSTPLGVTAGGEMILRCTPLHPPTGSSTVVTRLARFNSAGAYAGSMEGSGGYHPANGYWRHSDVTPSGWVACNLAPASGTSQPSAYRLGLWNAANANISLPPEADHWGYPVNVNDLPNDKVVLVGGKTVNNNYTGRVFLPDTTGQYQAVPSLSPHQIERFAGDGTAITHDHKLWRNGKLTPLRDLCDRYGELLDAGWNLTALKSNKHGVYLIVGESPTGQKITALLQPLRFELRVNADPARGWDDTGTEPWTSVGVGKTKSIVTLNLRSMTPELGNMLEIVPKPGSEGFVSLQNQTIEGQATEFSITGIAATPIAGCQIIVREKAHPEKISKPLNVHVLPPRIVNFGVYHAWAQTIPASILPANLPTVQAIQDELNNTFADQANITFNSCLPGIVQFDDCADVIGPKGQCINVVKGKTGKTYVQLLTEKASEAQGKHLKLFVIKDVVPADMDPKTIGLAMRQNSWCVMEGGVTMDVYSHETGHALGLTVNRSRKGDFHEDDGVDGPDRVKPLMSRTSGNSRWLRHQDWFEANTRAATNIYGH